MRTLLGEGGCPWDREQTLESIRSHMLEEAYEVADAIDQKDPEALREERGDVLFQVVFQSELAAKRYGFSLQDIIDDSCAKMIRRHPYVFGGPKVNSVDEAIKAWEQAKAKEKKGRSVLAGIPKALPALLRAARSEEKISSLNVPLQGHDEARQASCQAFETLLGHSQQDDRHPEALSKAFGNLLFALVRWARSLGVDSESALRQRLDLVSNRVQQAENDPRLKLNKTLWEDAH